MDSVEEPKNGNGTHDDPVVVEVKGRNNLTGGQIAKLIVLGVMIAVIIPTSVTIFLFVQQGNETRNLAEDNARLASANRDLIKRVDAQRLLGDQRAYDQCVAAEARDAVYVDWGGRLLTVARRLPQTDRDVRDLVSSLEDGIKALEPENEEECKPPTEVTP